MVGRASYLISYKKENGLLCIEASRFFVWGNKLNYIIIIIIIIRRKGKGKGKKETREWGRGRKERKGEVEKKR